MTNTEFQVIRIVVYSAIIIAAFVVLYLNRRDRIRHEAKRDFEKYAERYLTAGKRGEQ